MTLYFCKDRGTGFVNDGIDFFDDIEVGLVVCVTHAATSPRNCRELSRGQYGANTARKRIIAVIDYCIDSFDELALAGDGVGNCAQYIWWFDELLEYVALGGEGEAIVEHLVEQLIDHDIVILNHRFGAIAEIILECVHNTMQKLNDKQWWHLLLAGCHQGHTVPLHCDQIIMGRGNHGRHILQQQ